MKLKTLLFWLLLLGALSGLGWQVYQRLDATADNPRRVKSEAQAVPVDVAPIEHGAIALVRPFSGTLEARAEFVAAAKISGRIERLHVDLADQVKRGQIVAELDNAEYVQAVAQAEADLAVANANLAEARSLLRIAERELARIDQLQARGVSSAAQRDTAQAEQLAKAAHVQVTQAQVKRAEAVRQSARIRLGYTQVHADWHAGSAQRVVAERHVDEGETVAANAPLFRIVELDPIKAVIYVTEQDYAGLHSGQAVTLRADAFPQQVFNGEIEHIAPVFRENTRQARVEVRIANSDLRLKPGMFARVSVVLREAADATIVPAQALTRRNGQDGVFVLGDAAKSVVWRVVEAGIRQGERQQISGDGLQGRVVVLGQQLLDDGSAVILPADE
jgi:RND family efflux transporter MFP subunit